MRKLSPRLGLLWLALAAGCGGIKEEPGPTDRFVFPTAVAVLAPDPSAPSTHRVLVVSSNFDLTYDRDQGGSLISVDPVASVDGPPTPAQYTAAVTGGIDIASFGGQLAIAGSECGPDFASPRALVPSRVANVLYDVSTTPAGALSCGADCPLRLPTVGGLGDPYAVGVSCGGGSGPHAWVGYLVGPTTSGLLVEVDLTPGNTNFPKVASVPSGPVRSIAHDVSNDRLFFSIGPSFKKAPLHWIDLAGGCDVALSEDKGGCPQGVFDLFPLLRGADFSSIALSNADPSRPRRIYAAVRLYSVEVAETLGYRPGFDVGGVLAVLELSEGPLGPTFRLVRTVEIGLGVAEVKVLPARPGKRDVVAISAFDDAVVALWDDEQEALVKVFGRDPTTGSPTAGRQPFALAVEDRGGNQARVFVGSFDQSFVTPIDVDLAQPSNASIPMAASLTDPYRRIGVPRP